MWQAREGGCCPPLLWCRLKAYLLFQLEVQAFFYFGVPMSFNLYGYAFRVVYIDVVLLAVAAEFKSMLQCLSL